MWKKVFQQYLFLQKVDILSSPRACLPLLSYQQQRNFPTTKHWDPKWKKERKAKFLKIDLPDFDKQTKDANLKPDEIRMRRKKEGQLPPRMFQERPINISSTGSLFEPYVAPEGDGKSTIISKEGATQRYEELSKKGKSFLELRKIKRYEENFDTKEFSVQAQNILAEAQGLLSNIKENEDRLHDLVTEKAYVEMTFGLDKKSFRWKFVESIEPPRVVHVRTTSMLSKDNIYAQVTVRMHTKQILAVYDRFGRLMYGDAKLEKDVLEYIVMEKHVADEYGQWRVHGKIIPDWLPPQDPIKKSYRVPENEPIEEVEEESKQKHASDEPSEAVIAN